MEKRSVGAARMLYLYMYDLKVEKKEEKKWRPKKKKKKKKESMVFELNLLTNRDHDWD